MRMKQLGEGDDGPSPPAVDTRAFRRQDARAVTETHAETVGIRREGSRIYQWLKTVQMVGH
jgi:hypothetical protein